MFFRFPINCWLYDCIARRVMAGRCVAEYDGVLRASVVISFCIRRFLQFYWLFSTSILAYYVRFIVCSTSRNTDSGSCSILSEFIAFSRQHKSNDFSKCVINCMYYGWIHSSHLVRSLTGRNKLLLTTVRLYTFI